jgi:hypothetical protein
MKTDKPKIWHITNMPSEAGSQFVSKRTYDTAVEQLETRIKGMILSLQTHGQNIDVKFHIDWLKEVLNENR